jgi:hypothetical protein
MTKRFIYDADGFPFHAAGTVIWWDADAVLMYTCPGCRRTRGVPVRLVPVLACHAGSHRAEGPSIRAAAPQGGRHSGPPW